MNESQSQVRKTAMANTTVAPTTFSVEEFISEENLLRADRSVAEVFSMMFGFQTQVVDAASVEPPSSEADERTGIVGFSGSMRGSCQVQISTHAARLIASAMLGGAPIEENDDSIDDALGELCNMLAGGWKNDIPALADCALSPPTVISGGDYKVRLSKPSVKVSRSYRFDTHIVRLTLHREDIGPAQD
jgi:chemotaxis protein CheX